MKSNLPIKIEDILQIVALTMISFSLIGFFYVKIFFGSFGIEGSNYFVLSDYLAISVDKIYSMILVLLILITRIFINALLSKKDIKVSVDFDMKSFPISVMIGFIFIVCLMLYLTIQSYLTNDSNLYVYICTLLFLVVFVFILFVRKKDYIKEPYMIMILVLSVIGFLFYGTTKSDVDRLKKSTNNNAVVHLEDNENNSYLLIGVNSNYVFLYDKNQSKSLIFPKDKIEYIEIKD